MKKILILTISKTILTLNIFAQISQGGEPLSFSNQYIKMGLKVPTIAQYLLPTLNNDSLKLRADYLINEECATCKKEYYGTGIDVDIDIMKLATKQTMPDGSSLWFYMFKSTTAYSLQFYFDQFYLPEGARLFFYNSDKSMLLGAFTSQNNSESGKFPTQPIEGNQIIIEYYEPANRPIPTQLHIFKIIHDFKGSFTKSGPYGSSGTCNVDVNCSTGYGWEKEIRSVALILMYNNSINLVSRCSGALLNNQLQNQTPYFLSANHCLGSASNGGDPTYWVFLFNHQTSSCNGNGMSAPYTMSISSATLLSNNSPTDYAWMQLSSTPPSSYNVCYAGWDRTGSQPSNTVGIHHPAGDIKKISVDNHPAVVSGKNIAPPCNAITGNTHWALIWDIGTTEGGSSGSPLFNQSHRIIGQLHGGCAGCSSLNGIDMYGRFSESWNDGLFFFELDPNNTLITTLDTYCPTNYCGTTTLTNLSGSFTDGSGANNYANMSNCKWLIQPSAAGVNSITVTFNSFSTEAGYDSVIVYDGHDYWSPVIGRYSGNLSPFSITSSGCEMFIRFISDETNTAAGFSATYSSNIPCNGTSTLTAASGTFSDGSGNSNYGCSADCKWLIQPPCASSISLNFTTFNTESGYDFVKVYNGSTTASPLLGTFSGTNLPPTLTASSGSMLVHFVSDGDGQRPGWSANYTSNSTPPSASITPTTITICNGQSATLTASGGNSYSWSNGSTSASIHVSPTQTTTYTVTVTSSGCSATASRTVNVNPKPNTPTFAPTSGCSPLTVTANSSNCTGCSYQWSTGATGTTATFTANTNFTVTVTNSNNCTTSANGSVAITGQPAVAITPANPAFCTGGSVALTVSPSGSSYSWSGPNGFTSNAQSPSVNMPGTYSVTVTNPGSCSGTATASKSVTQHSSPTANAGNDVTIQQGNSTTLTATGGTSYTWSNGANSASTTVSPTQTTTYTVTVTDANGCTATDNVTVFVQSGGCNNTYTLNATSVNILASGGTASVNLTTDGGCSWNVNAGGCVGWVTPINPNGVGSATVSFSVQPNPLPSQRTCFVTIAGELFTIIQEAAPTTGVTEISDIQNISLFPNPNNGKFTLIIESTLHQKLNSNLYNAIGQLVLSKEVETNTQIEFDLSNNAKGIYYLRLVSETKFHSLKFVVH